MPSTSASSATDQQHASGSGAARAYSILIGLTSLLIIMQGLWAGFFIREGQDFNDHWVMIHARGADISIVLSIVSLIILLTKFRHRRDVIAGTGVMVVALLLEAFLGGLIGDHPDASIVHFPLAMALVALSVWLPLKARGLAQSAE